MDTKPISLGIFCIVIAFNLPECIADIEFSFNKDGCYKKDESLTLRAKYTGTGNLQSVNWYYSEQKSGNNVVLVTTCLIFGIADDGFPNNRLTYTCDSSTKTYTATLSSLGQSDNGKQWGVTFATTDQATPDIVKQTLTICDDGLESWKIALIVIFSFIGVAGGCAGVITLLAWCNKWMCFKKKGKNSVMI